MNWIDLLAIVGSLFMLYLGAEWSLESSERIGKRFGLSPYVIGALIIGFGTSLPEFFVSQFALDKNMVDMALGNLIGSNVANLLLVLGIATAMSPIVMERGKTLTHQLVLHLFLYLAMVPLLLLQAFNWMSMLPLLLVFLYNMYVVIQDIKISRTCLKEQNGEVLIQEKGSLRHDRSADADADDSNNTDEALFRPTAPSDHHNISVLTFLKLIVGLGFLYLGGEVLTTSTKSVSMDIGIDEYVISSILVAFGTSFPELVTSLMAVIKKKDTELIVGNIIGSNLFNCSFVMVSLWPYQSTFQKDFSFELQVLALASLVLIVSYFRHAKFARPRAFLYLALYAISVYRWIKGGS